MRVIIFVSVALIVVLLNGRPCEAGERDDEYTGCPSLSYCSCRVDNVGSGTNYTFVTCQAMNDHDLRKAMAEIDRPVFEIKVIKFTGKKFLNGTFIGIQDKRLFIENSRLEELNEEVFDGVSGLNELYIRYCKNLHKIRVGAFNGLSELSLLYLFETGVTAIAAGMLPESVVRLNLDSNYITTLDAGVFSELRNLKELHMRWNGLTTVSSTAFSSANSELDTVVFSDNNIQHISSGTFANLSNVIKLDLSFNSIEDIEAGAFTNDDNLELLLLYDNNLKTVKENVFSQLPNLTYIYLQRNNITNVQQGAFSSANSNLQVIHLESNFIRKVPANVFSSLSRLTELYLWDNNLKEVDPQSFSSANKHLKEIHLYSNKIARIHAKTFSELPNLTKLSLNLNYIENVEVGAFSADNLALTEIAVSSNRLSRIPTKLFNSLPILKTLKLNNNYIGAVEPHAFPETLHRLHLNTNELKSVDAGVLSELSALVQLDLQDNKLKTLHKGRVPTNIALNLEGEFN